MAQKRNRARKAGIVVIPKEEGKTGFLEGLKDLHDKSLGQLSPRDKIKREGKKDKPKPKAKPKPPKRGDKKYKVEKPIYRGEPLGSGKSSQEV